MSTLPRRVPLPPPNLVAKEDDDKPLIGLQARIAALQLNQLQVAPSRSPDISPPIKPKPPPPPPPHPRRRQSTNQFQNKAQSQVKVQSPVKVQTFKADAKPVVARRIPPIPQRQSTQDLKNPTPSQDTNIVRSLTRKPPPVPAALTPVPAPQETNGPQLPQRRVPPPPSKKAVPPVPSAPSVVASQPPTPPPVNLATRPQVFTASPEPLTQQNLAFVPGSSCLKCHDFSAVDHHAAMFPREHVTSLQTLACELTEPFETETEKARAIFTWMHHNIAYDVVNFFNGTVQHATPESLLQSGGAVCEGYSSLYMSLAEYAGLQVHKVSGHGKGFGYKPLQAGESIPSFQLNHAWNCVSMDGEWWLIDSTWGAGAVLGTSYTKRFNASWFTSRPVEFGRRHYPTDPDYQLLSEEEGGPVSWEEYISAAPGPEVYGSCGSLGFDPYLIQPYVPSLAGNNHYQFVLFKECEHMSTVDADNYCLVLYTGGAQPEPLYQNAEGGWSANIYIPKGISEVTLVYIDTVSGKDAKGLGPHAYVSSVRGKKSLSFQCIAKWDVN